MKPFYKGATISWETYIVLHGRRSSCSLNLTKILIFLSQLFTFCCYRNSYCILSVVLNLVLMFFCRWQQFGWRWSDGKEGEEEKEDSVVRQQHGSRKVNISKTKDLFAYPKQEMRMIDAVTNSAEDVLISVVNNIINALGKQSVVCIQGCVIVAISFTLRSIWFCVCINFCYFNHYHFPYCTIALVCLISYCSCWFRGNKQLKFELVSC